MDSNKSFKLFLICFGFLFCFQANGDEDVHFCAVRRFSVRLKPTFASERVFKITFGMPLVVIDEYEGWQKVYVSEDSIGWVPKGRLISKKEFRTDYFSDNFVKKKVKKYQQVAKKRPELQKTKMEFGFAVKGNVNIRKGPDLSAPVLAKTTKGKQYKITGHRRRWYRVHISGTVYGWIYGKFLKKLLRAPKKKMKFGYINKRGIRIRSGPGKEYPIISKDWFGKFYEILKEEKGWSQVVIGKNKTGWIYGRLLSNISRLSKNGLNFKKPRRWRQ